MTRKKEIETALRQFSGGAILINKRQIGKALQRGETRVNSLVGGLQHTEGKSHEFYVWEVAERIIEEMQEGM